MRPETGRVLVDGIDTTIDPHAVRRALGVLPDARGVYKRLTARENIAYFGELHGLSAAQVAERTDIVLEQCFLTDLADRRARVLSRGQKQRLGLARALLHDPSVLVLDEPANGLDPAGIAAAPSIGFSSLDRQSVV